MIFIIDTDHISLFQKNHPDIVAHVAKTSPEDLTVSVITVEEQLRGRLNRIRQARNDEEIIRAYKNLMATFLYFRSVKVLGFNENVQIIFKKLRNMKIRIGTQDLRIAAIALAYNAILLTRNKRDFEQIPSLKIEDWA